MAESLPTLALAVTVCVYWLCVGAMVRRVRRRARGVKRVLIPALWTERVMWFIWVPLVAAWMALPLLALLNPGAGGWWLRSMDAPPAAPLFAVARFAAAGVGAWCLVASMRCWAHMGRQWRMAVDPTQTDALLTGGPFASVRHPIYSLSMLLMVCSVIIVASPAMLLVAVVHITLMNLKAISEEQHLRTRFGERYDRYCATTGRFVPRRQSAGLGRTRRGITAAIDPERGSTERSSGAALHVNAQRLSKFQQAMLLFEETHPYNAVHVLRLAGRVDAAALHTAINDASRAAGIGELVIDRERQEFTYRPATEVAISVLPEANDADDLLRRRLAVELNSPFPPGPHHPIRWTAFDEEGGAGHYLIAAYHHVASDARGIELLLANVLRVYQRLEVPGEQLTARCDTAAGGARTTGSLGRLMRALGVYYRFRCAHKMRDERDEGNMTHVAMQSAPDDLPARLSAACKRRGVGINDAFLAALVAAIAERTSDRRTSRRRRKIGVATAMSERRRTTEDAGYFGVRLGEIAVLLDRPDAPLEDVLSQVSAVTTQSKAAREQAPAMSALQVLFVRCVWPLLMIPNERRSYRKLFPICGGVSTVIADSGLRWSERGVTRYVRACPCGAPTPIVLAPTMCDGRLELTLTYRLSSMNDDQAEQLLIAIIGKLSEIAATERIGTSSA